MMVYFFACSWSQPELPVSQLPDNEAKTTLPLQIQYGQLQLWTFQPQRTPATTHILTFAAYPALNDIENCLALYSLSDTENWIALAIPQVDLAQKYLLQQNSTTQFNVHSCNDAPSQ